MFQGIYRDKQVHQADIDNVLKRGWNVGIKKIIITAGKLDESLEAITIAKKDSRLYTTVGVHPTRCLEFENNGQDPDKYMQQLLQCAVDNKDKVCAIGEFGLDYDRLNFCPKELQKKYFEKQFYLAGETKLPLFLHLRNAGPDFLDIISRCRSKFTKGVVHSFDGSAEICKSLIDLGLYIGLNGCSLKTVDNLKVIAQIPVDRILIETDAPWCQIRPSHAGFKHIKNNIS